MQAAPAAPSPMAQPSPRIEYNRGERGEQGAVEYLCYRVERIAARYANPSVKRLFFVQPLPDRLLIGFNRYALPVDLVQKVAQELRPALNGRLVVHSEQAPLFVQIGYYPALTAGSSKLATLPAYGDRQVMVFGPSGAGKSSAVQYLLHEREGLKVFLNPHYEPGKCHPETVVVGAGLNWGAIELALDVLEAELRRRYQRLMVGDVDFQPMTVAVDELSALAHKLPRSGRLLIDLAQQGRKVKIYTILTPHSTEVAQLGFEGAGDARESFLFVELRPVLPGQEHRPRVATVYLGNPRRKGNRALGQYLVPAPPLYQGRARLVDDLAPLLGVSEGVSVETFQGPETGRNGPGGGFGTGNGLGSYEAVYATGTPEALLLAEFLTAAGIARRKVARCLPMNFERALGVADEAAKRCPAKRAKPAPGSEAERWLTLELAQVWGMPANRIAGLLDGNDQANLSRVQRYLSGDQA